MTPQYRAKVSSEANSLFLLELNEKLIILTSYPILSSHSEFHVTDDTDIKDPFEFLEPFVEAKGMHITKRSFPFLPVLLLVYLFFNVKRILEALDYFGIFTEKKNRLHEAIESDNQRRDNEIGKSDLSKVKKSSNTNYFGPVIPPSMLIFLCNTSFLNRTKAALRLDYEPIVESNESLLKSLDWYKKYLEV